MTKSARFNQNLAKNQFLKKIANSVCKTPLRGIWSKFQLKRSMKILKLRREVSKNEVCENGKNFDNS